MKNYLAETIEGFPEDITREHPIPAASRLFTVNKDCKKLEEDKARAFHTATAKLLFMCNRARLDIMVAVAFLTTR
eukprot:12193902-Ditylum_brightwellii.AAC.1